MSSKSTSKVLMGFQRGSSKQKTENLAPCSKAQKLNYWPHLSSITISIWWTMLRLPPRPNRHRQIPRDRICWRTRKTPIILWFLPPPPPPNLHLITTTCFLWIVMEVKARLVGAAGRHRPVLVRSPVRDPTRWPWKTSSWITGDSRRKGNLQRKGQYAFASIGHNNLHVE